MDGGLIMIRKTRNDKLQGYMVRLQLTLSSHRQIKVSGLGGVPTYISSSTQVKVTLGHRVVYVLDLWVTNIGEGVDVLLGMDFMFSAGVRLCIREGLFILPDEESILMYGEVVQRRQGFDLPIESPTGLHLRSGESATVRIRYGQSNPETDVVWAGRGDRWVTQVLYGPQTWATAIQVVNISDRDLWIDARTPVAQIIEYGHFPTAGRFVRPGLLRYQEWQQLIFESTLSAQARLRARRYEQMLQDEEPPAVQTQSYQWPTKLLMRPRTDTEAVRMVRLQDEPIVTPGVDSDHSEPAIDEKQVPGRDVSGGPEDGTSEYNELSSSPSVSDSESEGVERSQRQGSSPNNADEEDQVSEEATEEEILPDEPVRKDEDPEMPSVIATGTPVEKLELEYARCMRVQSEELDLEPAVYLHEGSELTAQLKDELPFLPELLDLSPECDITKADVGEPGLSTDTQDRKLRGILKHHRKIFLGDGNAAPAPARGVICDLDVGDARPVSQRPRSIAPHIMIKVYELLKKLLETGLVEHSESPWASPIVIVLKKNGVDIRMCIDYRIVNGFIRLSNYPLPLIDDLLVGFESAMWFMSLDMASGFWAIRMTERAKLISAFVCPFGHFQWVRMPFGLKNAPLIYQHVINNCLWGFVRLPPEEEALVDQEVLDYLGLDPQDSENPERAELDPDVTHPEDYLSALTEQMTVFKRNIPTPSRMGPVLGRSSYIDDIAHGAATWDQLCDDLDALLYRLRYWNISVSLPKIEFGKRTIPYLSHEIGAEGIRATPKIVKGIQDLPFPKTLKGVQSFLGSLNYYHKFIEDFPVVAAVLYELTDDQVRAGRDLLRAKEAFAILKQKIVSTPMLRHPDRSKPFVIIPHANQWAACAVLGQEYDGVIQPVRFTGRVLHDAELRYHIAEKEILAVIWVLQTFKTLVEGCPLIVYTRYSVLKWVIKSKTADGRTVPWGVALSHYDLDIRKVQRDEDGLSAILAAGITPREHLDEVAENLIPAKGCIRAPPVLSVEMLATDYSRVVLSFDGAAKTSTKQGSCGCILWQLPEWTILDARGFILNGVTVNDAE
ncbi:hypothetical protein PR003_g20044 [Phytophthora rubi]|uniref:RNA-directed DNA polymerase n=1 Tax=Phytophthora rubi TaxID=129364 RepID=A0A6A4DN14_9STRA|nr:hypothetical protein PR003_g20044 [Phytophthora rubi]